MGGWGVCGGVGGGWVVWEVSGGGMGVRAEMLMNSASNSAQHFVGEGGVSTRMFINKSIYQPLVSLFVFMRLIWHFDDWLP
jgi:hypothetical protein